MAIVAVTIDRTTWTGSFKPTGGEYSVDYRVEFDSLLQGPAAARNAVGLRIGSAYRVGNDSDPASFLKSLDPRCEAGKVFRVTAKWGPKDPEQQEPNPFKRPTVWSYRPQVFSEVVWRDSTGKAILNSAGEYFDPPVEDDVSRPVIVARRNVPLFDDARADRFANRTNKDTWKGRKPGTVKCIGISGDGPQFEGEFTYFVEELEFHINPDGWDKKILDQGRNARISGHLVPIKVKDADGNELPDYVAEPVPLDKDGDDAIEMAEPTPDKVKYLTFQLKKRINFAELGL